MEGAADAAGGEVGGELAGLDTLEESFVVCFHGGGVLDGARRDAAPAAEDAVLFLWAVNCLLPEALEVISAWGFSYKSNLVWVKPSLGLGYWTRNRHELLLFATRGQIAVPDPEQRPDSVIEANRGRHSQKPAAVYDLIERAYPRHSKLELFARGTPRRGWHAWGNETTVA